MMAIDFDPLNQVVILHVEDYPQIDMDGDPEAWRDMLGFIAYATHRRRPRLMHFKWMQGGKVIGEMIFPPMKGLN